jgi:hypothetical protein
MILGENEINICWNEVDPAWGGTSKGSLKTGNNVL